MTVQLSQLQPPWLSTAFPRKVEYRMPDFDLRLRDDGVRMDWYVVPDSYLHPITLWIRRETAPVARYWIVELGGAAFKISNQGKGIATTLLNTALSYLRTLRDDRLVTVEGQLDRLAVADVPRLTKYYADFGAHVLPGRSTSGATIVGGTLVELKARPRSASARYPASIALEEFGPMVGEIDGPRSAR